MATIEVKKTVEVETDIDVSVEDFYNEMSSKEEEMLNLIIEGMGFDDIQDLAHDLLDGDVQFQLSQHDTFMDTTFMEALVKIFNSRMKLSANQVDKFIEYANKL